MDDARTTWQKTRSLKEWKKIKEKPPFWWLFDCEVFFFLRFFVAALVEVLNDQRLSDLFTHVMGFFLVIMRIGVSLDQSASL